MWYSVQAMFTNRVDLLDNGKSSKKWSFIITGFHINNHFQAKYVYLCKLFSCLLLYIFINLTFSSFTKYRMKREV